MSTFDPGQASPTVIPAPASLPRSDGSGGQAVPGIAPQQPPMHVETPSRAAGGPQAPVDVTLPLSGTGDGSRPSGRARRHLVGPLVGVKPLPDPNYSADGKPTQLPPVVAGQAEGAAVTAIQNRKAVDPRFDSARLFMPMSDRGR